MSVIDEQERLNILADMIKIKSVNDHELEVAQYLQNLLAEYGIESKIIKINETRANLVAEIGQGTPILAVSGHMDVVAPGNLTAWDSDPFTLTERDGKLFGRGVTDMKAGLAALVIAMIELKSKGLPKQGTVRLLATMGEEIGEAGSAKFYQQGYMKDTDGLLVAEPSSIYGTAAEQKGSYDIKFISKGKSVHSSTPEQGFNALVPLIQLLNEANDYFEQIPTGKIGPVRFNIDVLNGGDQINSLPDIAEALINVRTIPEFSNDQVDLKINELVQKYNANGAQISTKLIMSELPIATSAKNQLIQKIQSIGEKYAHQELVVTSIPGVTDASNLAKDQPNDFAFAVYGPGDMSQHQVNESLPKQMYFDFIELYQELFIEFLTK